MLSLPSAGENRSFFIMPEIYNGVNESAFCFLRFCTGYLLLLLMGVIIGVQKVEKMPYSIWYQNAKNRELPLPVFYLARCVLQVPVEPFANIVRCYTCRDRYDKG